MSSKVSSVRIRSSEIPAEARKRYGFFDDGPELDLYRTSSDRHKDQKLKDDVTSALYNLELDSVKPSFDVLTHTGFRRGYQGRKHSPGDNLHMTLKAAPLPGRLPRRHSYIEPRTIHLGGHLLAREEVERALGEPVTDPAVRVREVKEVIHREPVRRRPLSYAWHQSSEPLSQPTFKNIVSYYTAPTENRILEDYRATLPRPSEPRRQGDDWSAVYRSRSVAIDPRSRSTPPDFHRLSRVPIGDRLTRRRNQEYNIGVKVAESQTELDAFNRLLDRNFGTVNRYPWIGSSAYSAPYPSTWTTSYYSTPTYYEYKAPRTEYRYSVYSTPTTDYTYHQYNPPTRATEHSQSSVSYAPYTTSTKYYSTYVPSYGEFGRSSFQHEPWYAPYSRTNYYYSPRPPLAGSYPTGRYVTRYLF